MRKSMDQRQYSRPLCGFILFSGNHLDNAENDNYRNERRKKSLDPGSLNPLLPTLLQFH